MAKKKDESLIVVSFKVSPEIFKELKQYAQNQKDDSGKELSPSMGARRLMTESLNRLKRK